MMNKFFTVAAGLIACSMLTLVAAPAVAHRSDDSGYDSPGIYAPPPVYVEPRPAHGWYQDRDDNGWSKRHEHRNVVPFAASVTMAPPRGATVRGVIRLEVRGSGLANVELLPASGYIPRLGVFNVSADGTFAWLDFDTTTLPEGLLHARISAFNVPARHPNASEIIAMPPRRWNVR